MSKETFEECMDRLNFTTCRTHERIYLDRQKKIDELESHKRRLDRENSRFIGKIKELEGEVENRKAQVHWKCIEIDRLEGEVESLTECELKELIGKTCIQWDEYNKCQGCKNSEAVKEWRGKK